MIDANEIIEQQLNVANTTVMKLSDGSEVTLTPARFVPRLDDETMRLCLNGEWQLKPCRTRQEAQLSSPETSTERWSSIEQPGPVFYADPEEKPSSVENWNRVKLTHINPDEGTILRRDVRIPAAWRGRRIYLHFDAVYPAARFYCNGQLLGEHLSGLTPAEFDVTAIVKPGKSATVAVGLIRRHPYVQLDMPRHAMEFTGISQDCWFHATQRCRISDYHLFTSLDDSLASGAVSGSVWVHNIQRKPVAGKLSMLITNPEGRRVGSAAKKISLVPDETKAVSLAAAVRKVLLWNDENPNLYTATITLEVEGQEPQSVSYRTGFSRFELKNRRPTLNGNPVKFRGVNHLTHHPELGMHTPKEWLRECLTMMKRANVNCIRTHFLGPPALSELCDEMGFYLVQELPIDWGTDYVQDKAFVGPVMQRLEGGVRRDRHHPSLMVWSVGNENMPANMEAHDDFYNHLRIYGQFVKTLDPTRPTMFPPPGPANKVEAILETRLGDIADTHYSFKMIRRMNEEGAITTPETWDGAMSSTTREEALACGWSGVWFSSEYGISNMIPDLLNSPYVSIITDVKEDSDSGKNTQQVFIDRLSREWGYMRDDPSCLGGAYFPWIAAGSGDTWGWTRWGEDADWGIVNRDLTAKPAFWGMRVLFSPVSFPERLEWMEDETELVFEVKNGYNSIDLSQCTLRTMMAGGGTYRSMMREWQDVPVSCSPGQSATVRVPIWNEGTLRALKSGSGVICRCILLDPTGYRPITADILVTPKKITKTKSVMPIGPDAVLE